MLVKLYDLPSYEKAISVVEGRDILVRRAMTYERSGTVSWVKSQFNDSWADECSSAFGGQPVGCYIAVNESRIIGFCCLDTTFRNFIGPIGIADQWRGLGVGRALVLSALQDMRVAGFAYAIVGDVGQPAFFKKVARAVEINGSTPGPYPGKLTPG